MDAVASGALAHGMAWGMLLFSMQSTQLANMPLEETQSGCKGDSTFDANYASNVPFQGIGIN